VLAGTLTEVEAKTVDYTPGDVEAEALVDTLLNTLSKVVAKAIADTLTCVEAETLVKTEADTLGGVKTYTDRHNEQS